MKIIVCDKIWDIQPKEGLLEELSKEYQEINLTQWVDQTHFELYMAEKWIELSTKELIGVYKIAHYLNAEQNMIIIAKEIAKRISLSTYDDIKHILELFDILT